MTPLVHMSTWLAIGGLPHGAQIAYPSLGSTGIWMAGAALVAALVGVSTEIVARRRARAARRLPAGWTYIPARRAVHPPRRGAGGTIGRVPPRSAAGSTLRVVR